MSLSYALLGLLRGSPINGYAIKALFDEAINFVWQAELSQIYRELESLEKKGLLCSTIEPQRDRPSKRLYQVTEAGRLAFEKWATTIPDSFATPKRDEFSLRIFFGSGTDKELMKEEFRRYIEHMRGLRKGAEKYTNLAERFPGDQVMARADQICREDPYCDFIRRRAVLVSEAQILWAEECLAKLEAGPGS